jgi:hypothetical protein
MLRTVLRDAGGLRVDHIIGLFRLWWVPKGRSADEGTYVRYDHEALVGILALEAHRAGALVVGEDLGVVEPWVRDYLTERGILGTSILWFEKNAGGAPLRPESYRELCLSTVTTHDLPPTAGYLDGVHIDLRAELDLLTRPVEEERIEDEAARERVLQFIDREVAAGRQAYVVYPVIEESEKSDLKAATTMFDVLSEGAFRERRVALLHGRVPADERDAIMRRFRDGEIDVLVATTVIEVGIDVPNATVMLVEHPERFGLSQLHQLRGRVGRGAEASYCILLGDVSPETKQRLDVFVGSDDGFEIAREDLRLRGMGDLFGERQSGVATFRVADPLRDELLNESAREAADRMLAEDPELESPAHAPVRRVLGERYARSLELFRVG